MGLAPTTAPDSAGTPGADAAVAHEDLLARLVAQGIVEGMATRLLVTRGPAIVRAQLAYAVHRPWTKSPAGALVQAIKEDWEPPTGWVDARIRAAAAARLVAEEHARATAEAEERRRRAVLPPEERIEGPLGFWLLGQRRRGREPTEAEVAVKRAQLLARLEDAGPPQAPGEAPILSGEGPG